MTSPKKEKESRSPAQELNDALAVLPEDEATTLAMKLQRTVAPYRAAIENWGDILAVLVAHTGRKGAIHCGDRLVEQEQWVRTWFNRLVKSKVENSNNAGERASSSHQAAPMLLETTPGEEPLEDQEERLLETQKEADEELYAWHQRELAQEAQRADRAALQAHLGWSERPPSKRVRVTVEMKTRTGSRYSEMEIAEGDHINIQLGVSVVDHGREFLHRGRPTDPTTAMEDLRKEEDRIAAGRPETRPSEPGVMFSTNSADIKPWYDAWRAGRISFQELVSKTNREIAGFIVEASEVADLDLDTAPDVSTEYREAWQKGRPVGELLSLRSCQQDFERWSTGDLMEADVVDKWGGDVLRTFRAWAALGRSVETSADPAHHGPDKDGAGHTLPDEEETLPYNMSEVEERESRRRVQHRRRGRQRVGTSSEAS
ncbi:unnamed protein product [Symbiodinium sp. CCMP2592]|nr:unnamed protein product [Symbiodinium sp. CCMP2592]